MNKIIAELRHVYLGIQPVQSLELTDAKVSAYNELYRQCLNYSELFRKNLQRQLFNAEQFRLLAEVEEYVDLTTKMNLVK